MVKSVEETRKLMEISKKLFSSGKKKSKKSINEDYNDVPPEYWDTSEDIDFAGIAKSIFGEFEKSKIENVVQEFINDGKGEDPMPIEEALSLLLERAIDKQVDKKTYDKYYYEIERLGGSTAFTEGNTEINKEVDAALKERIFDYILGKHPENLNQDRKFFVS